METQPTIENKLISNGTITDKGKSIKEGNKGEKDEIKYKKELFEKRKDIKYLLIEKHGDIMTIIQHLKN